MKIKTLSPEPLHKMDACWRVCRILSLIIDKEYDHENNKSF